jgi:hypothetical protein
MGMGAVVGNGQATHRTAKHKTQIKTGTSGDEAEAAEL